MFKLFQTKPLRARAMPWLLAVASLLALPLATEAKTRTSKTPIVAKKKLGFKAARYRAIRAEPARPSFGQIYGLHGASDVLDLKSSVALVLDQNTNEVLFSKNPQAVLPIASITKLMTALVVAEAKQPLDEMLSIGSEDVDTEKGSTRACKSARACRAKKCCTWP